jgi:ArsR family transcriptional regulator
MGVLRHMPVASVESVVEPMAAGEPGAVGQAQRLLRALADPIRLQVVQALRHGERCVCELTSELDLAQSKLSFHLKVLKEAGLIRARQEGRWIYYRLEPSALLLLRDWLGELAAGCQAPALVCS